MEKPRDPFMNLRCQVYPESALRQAEICMVHDVVGAFAEQLGRGPAGTFVLDCEPDGGKPTLVTRFELADGVFNWKSNSVLVVPSNILVPEGIDEMLKLSKSTRYYNKYPCLQGLRSPKDAPSGIYRADELLVMVLRAVHGRFLCGYQVQGPMCKRKQNEAVVMATLRGVALVLSAMNDSDRILSESVDKILHDYRSAGSAYCIQNSEVKKVVSDLMDERGGSVTAALWREWRERPENAELMYFG